MSVATKKKDKQKHYIDEDISDRIAVALRSKGFDVISAHEVNMRGKTGKEQLEYAIKHNRTILTRNIKHFINFDRINRMKLVAFILLILYILSKISKTCPRLNLSGGEINLG